MNVLLFSAVLVVGLMAGACHNPGGNGSQDGGANDDAGEVADGGPGDGGLDGGTVLPPDAGTDGGVPESGCNVALQRGCDAGALCLRGLQEDGGQDNLCFPGGCDLVAQNCPSGNKCTYVRQGNETRRRCVPDGTVAEGAVCQSMATPEGDFYDTCKAGLYCADQTASDGSSTFTCQKFCYGSAQCTAPRDCIEVLRFTGSQELPRVCGTPGPACDLLVQGCANPLGCYPSPKNGAVCVATGTVADGTRCTYSNDCRLGSACVDEGTGRACRRLCRSPSGSPACSSGHCEPLNGFPGVGACVP